MRERGGLGAEHEALQPLLRVLGQEFLAGSMAQGESAVFWDRWNLKAGPAQDSGGLGITAGSVAVPGTKFQEALPPSAGTGRPNDNH